MASLCVLFSLALLLLILGGDHAASGYPVSLPGCPDKCGNTSIPYPFGTQEGCFLNRHFFINCSTSNIDSDPKAFLTTTRINVTEINLSSGELRSWCLIAHQCFSSNGSLSLKSNTGPDFWLGKFTVSYTKNKLTVVGCDAYAYFGSKGATFNTGCISTCSDLQDVTNGSCAGVGCCQTSLPRRSRGVSITLQSFNNLTWMR